MRFLYRVFVVMGPVNAFRCFFAKRTYRKLQAEYGFDPWHASAPYWCRRYKREVVRLVNALKPSSVCDVGCGLGEIIARINAEHRWGIDRDRCVIDAARVLHPEVDFLTGTLETALATAVGPIDVLIALGWLHGLEADQIVDLFQPILKSGRVQYLLLEELEYEAERSTRHHFAVVLSEFAHVVATSTADPDRRLVLMRVHLPSDTNPVDSHATQR